MTNLNRLKWGIFSFGFFVFLSCQKSCPGKQGESDALKPPDYSNIVIQQVIKQDITEGIGDLLVTPGHEVTLHYIGWIYDPKQPMNRGQKFGETTPDQPLVFKVGEGKVIKGWEDGIIGMKEGGKRNLIIPSHLAYGEKGSKDIPPHSILLMDVMMMSVK